MQNATCSLTSMNGDGHELMKFHQWYENALVKTPLARCVSSGHQSESAQKNRLGMQKEGRATAPLGWAPLGNWVGVPKGRNRGMNGLLTKYRMKGFTTKLRSMKIGKESE